MKFGDKVVVVTGGTGSFGNEVAQQFLRQGVGELRIFSRDEKKQDDMRRELRSSNVKFYLGDVRDRDSLVPVLKGANYLFHAAALKQVPSCEFFPMEAVKTNILGTENVLNMSTEMCLDRVVVLSTDKAVYPINAMGQSKALMEKLVISRARGVGSGKTVVCATRYGNVMASRGSVIPLFVQQALRNDVITVTDPEMTRFMMSLSDAAELVNHAFLNGSVGDLYVQKAPAATIMDLALAVKEIFNSSSDVQVIGTRHGEKLYESLLSREEMIRAEDQGEYFKVAADNRDLNYGNYISAGEVNSSDVEDYNSHNTVRLNLEEVKALLLGLEYIKNTINELNGLRSL